MSEQVDEAELAVLDEDGVEIVDAGPAVTATPGTPKVVKKKRRRKPVKRATIWLHRWLSLVLGTVLVVITTTGAIVLYQNEWTHWTNQEVYSVTDTRTPMPLADAIDVVAKAHPEFQAGSVIDERGLYKVQSLDDEAHPGFYGVDPGTGRITGFANSEGGFMGLMVQIHDCFFSCVGSPAYLSFMEATPIGETSWAGIAFAVTGLMLVFLAITGVWLWWPSFRNWTHGFRIRTRKGRYARDYDLHQVIGMAAVPFLIMWGLTGANFYTDFVGDAWIAVTGGHHQEFEEFLSDEAKEKEPDITLAQATDAAERVAGSDSRLVYAANPAPDDATSTYYFYFSKGWDPYEYGGFPGDYGVGVDRHDATRTHLDNFSDYPHWSDQVLNVWANPTAHFGMSVNGGWRIIWFVLGLTPLILMITGISTWLAKWSVRRRRKQLAAAAKSVPSP